MPVRRLINVTKQQQKKNKEPAEEEARPKIQIDVDFALETLYLPKDVSYNDLPKKTQLELRRRVPNECGKGLLPVICPVCHTRGHLVLRYFNNRHVCGKLQPRFRCEHPTICRKIELNIPPGGLGPISIAKKSVKTLEERGLLPPDYNPKPPKVLQPKKPRTSNSKRPASTAAPRPSLALVADKVSSSDTSFSYSSSSSDTSSSSSSSEDQDSRRLQRRRAFRRCKSQQVKYIAGSEVEAVVTSEEAECSKATKLAVPGEESMEVEGVAAARGTMPVVDPEQEQQSVQVEEEEEDLKAYEYKSEEAVQHISARMSQLGELKNVKELADDDPFLRMPMNMKFLGSLGTPCFVTLLPDVGGLFRPSLFKH